MESTELRGDHPATSEPNTTLLRSYSGNTRSTCAAVIIIDKSAVFRAGLEALLAKVKVKVAKAFETIVEFSLADSTKRLKINPAPILLVGLDEDAEAGFEWAAKLADAQFRIILLGARFEPTAVLAAIESGVRGYLLKDEVEPLVLLNALKLVERGSLVIPSGWTSFAATLDTVPELKSHEMTAAPVSPLSKGELSILELLTRGASNKEIALGLGIAEATVKVRVGFLLRKLRVSNRTQAAMWARRNLVLAALGFAFGSPDMSQIATGCF